MQSVTKEVRMFRMGRGFGYRAKQQPFLDVTVKQELVQRQEEEAEALWANFEPLRSAQEMVAKSVHLWRPRLSEMSSGLNNTVRVLGQLFRVQKVQQAVLQESSSGHQRLQW